MFSADQIADIQGFNKVYQNLMKQIDSAILETGYSLTEKDVLLEISKTRTVYGEYFDTAIEY